MRLKMKRIAPLPAGKMLGALYGVMALLIVPFMLMFMALGSFAARSHGGADAPPLPLMFGMGVGFLVMLPVFYALMGFVTGLIGACVYNLLTKWVGGFEFDFESLEPPVAPVPPLP